MDTTTREDRNGPSPRAPGWCLYVMHHPDVRVVGLRASLSAGEALELGRETVLFGGRTLADARVSRAHTTVRALADGSHCSVEDRGSANGTFVNGARIRAAPLREGDLLRVGPYLFTLQKVTPQLLDAARDEGAVPLRSPAMASVWFAARTALEADAALLLYGEHGVGARALTEALDARLGGCGLVDLPTSLAPRVTEPGRRRAPRPYGNAIETWSVDERAELARRVRSGSLRAVLSWHDVEPESPARLEFIKRSGVLSLRVPPLRERLEDLPLLVAAALQGQQPDAQVLETDLAQALFRAPWPGNLASLESFVSLLARSGRPTHSDEPIRWRHEYGALLGLASQPSSTEARPSAPDAPAKESSPSTNDRTVRVARDGSWLVAPVSRRISLEDRHALRRVLEALADGHQRAPGETITVDVLIARGWPGVRLAHDVALNRLYAAIAALRRMGLREALQRTEEGYRFDPRAALVVVDDP